MHEQEQFTTLERSLLERAAETRCPVNGSLELLPLCNMDCRMCYVRLSRSEMEAQGRLRTAEEWLSLGKQMQQAGVLFLLLTGGEPLMYPGFRDLYLGLKKMGFILTVNTNGTLLDEDWADFFAKNKPRRINITLYGADENTYAALCRFPGGFDRTVRAIRLLRERGVDVRIGASVTPENLKDLNRIYELCRELDAPVNVDAYMVPCVRERDRHFAFRSRLAPKDAAHASFQAMKAELGPEGFRQYTMRVLPQLGDGPRDPRSMTCMAATCSFTVNWQGYLRPCVMLLQPSVPVFETGFEAAWRQTVAGAEGLCLNQKCLNCELRPVCKTCVASAYWETGSFDGVPDYNCCCAEEFAALLRQSLEEHTHE